MLFGLGRVTALTGSLLLNLEAPCTVLIAVGPGSRAPPSVARGASSNPEGCAGACPGSRGAADGASCAGAQPHVNAPSLDVSNLSHSSVWRSPVWRPPNMRATQAMTWRSSMAARPRASVSADARTRDRPRARRQSELRPPSSRPLGYFGSSAPSAELLVIVPSQTSAASTLAMSCFRCCAVCFERPCSLPSSREAAPPVVPLQFGSGCFGGSDRLIRSHPTILAPVLASSRRTSEACT
jgi:hypothetical protein